MLSLYLLYKKNNYVEFDKFFCFELADIQKKYFKSFENYVLA